MRQDIRQIKVHKIVSCKSQKMFKIKIDNSLLQNIFNKNGFRMLFSKKDLNIDFINFLKLKKYD